MIPDPRQLWLRLTSHAIRLLSHFVCERRLVVSFEEVKFQVAKRLENLANGSPTANLLAQTGAIIAVPGEWVLTFRACMCGAGHHSVAKSIRYASSCHLRPATCNMLRKQRAKLICCRLSVNCQSTTATNTKKNL